VVLATIKRIPHWLIIVAVATVARLVPTLWAEPLWYDESFTAWITTRLSWQDMFTAIRGDVHPPLLYIIERLTTAILGVSEISLRLPSLLFGVLAVWLLWRIAGSAGLDRTAALIAGLLGALMPAAIYYSVEARMYALLCCAVLGMVYAVLNKRWLLFVPCAVATCYTQNLGLFYVVVIGGVFVAQQTRSWRSLRIAVLAVSAIGLAYLPWATVLLEQARAVGAGWWMQPITLGYVIAPIADMTMFVRAADGLYMAIYIIAFASTMIAVIKAGRWLISRSGLVILAAVFGVPALIAVISVVYRPVYLARAMIPSAMLLAVLWAWLWRLNPYNRRVAVTALGLCLFISLVGLYNGTKPRTDTLKIIQPIIDGWQDGDVIYHTQVHTALNASYYLDMPYVVEPLPPSLTLNLSQQTRTAMGFKMLSLDKLLATRPKRVWVICYIMPTSPQAEIDIIERIRAMPETELIYEKATKLDLTRIYLVNYGNNG